MDRMDLEVEHKPSAEGTTETSNVIFGGTVVLLLGGLALLAVLLGLSYLLEFSDVEEHHAHKEPTAADHVYDTEEWHLFHSFGPAHWRLPRPLGFQITKYMVLQLLVALLIIAIYVPLAQRVQRGDPPHGGWDNCFEVLLTFLRDKVARPNIGHGADKYVPFLWALFLFILLNNLLGMIPLAGSATASLWMTLGLAICVFFAIHVSGMMEMGVGNYLMSLWPKFDVPFGMGIILKPFIFLIEWFGVLVRNVVLAVRLFANLFAGHMVLATILVFIYMAGKAGNEVIWATVTVASVLGMVALSLLEIFVAFLQAFIFVFLTSLFMGMALHPEH